MRKIALLLAAIVATLASGCAIQRPLTSPTCSGSQCQVFVDMSSGCPREVDPQTLQPPPGGQEVHIVWHIRPAGSTSWLFDDNGVSFPPGQNPNGLFDQKQRRDQGRAFHWRDNNNITGRFKYVVSLHDSSGQPCTIDPFIHNQ